MSSKRRSDPAAAGNAEQFEVLTTEDDIAAQRRLRREQGEAFRLVDLDALKPPEGLPIRRRRTTSEGWEPFRL